MNRTTKNVKKNKTEEKHIKKAGSLREKGRKVLRKQQEWLEEKEFCIAIFPNKDTHLHGVDYDGNKIPMTDFDCRCEPIFFTDPDGTAFILHRSFATGLCAFDDVCSDCEEKIKSMS